MKVIQLVIKNSNGDDFYNWQMTIYDPKKDVESAEFGLNLVRGYREQISVIPEFGWKSVQDLDERLYVFIEKLVNTKKVEIVVEANEYSNNRKKFDKFRKVIKRVEKFDSNNGCITLYSKNLEFIDPYKKVSIVTV